MAHEEDVSGAYHTVEILKHPPINSSGRQFKNRQSISQGDQPVASDVIYTNSIKLGGALYFAYDIFVTTNKVVLIGPLEVKIFKRFNIDVNQIFVRYQGVKIKGEVVPDNHKHTLIIEFCSKKFEHLPPSESIEIDIFVNKNLQKLMRIKSYDDKSYDLCLTTLEKNETFLLEPWINYHLSMGVEHFFIYDNDSGDFNEIKNILTPYINAGIVSLIFWPFPKQMQESGISGQTTQQNHCLYTNHNTNWLGLSDVDEFLVPKKANNLGQFLDPYKKLRSSSAALSIQSAWFGCNNGIEFTQSDFLSKLDKRHSNFEPKHNRQKTIAIPRNVKVYSVHMVVYGQETIYLEPDLIALNHYYIFSNRQCDHALYDQIADHRIGQLISENRIRLVGNRAS